LFLRRRRKEEEEKWEQETNARKFDRIFWSADAFILWAKSEALLALLLFIHAPVGFMFEHIETPGSRGVAESAENKEERGLLYLNASPAIDQSIAWTGGSESALFLATLLLFFFTHGPPWRLRRACGSQRRTWEVRFRKGTREKEKKKERKQDTGERRRGNTRGKKEKWRTLLLLLLLLLSTSFLRFLFLFLFFLSIFETSSFSLFFLHSGKGR
jgi:hypothetical protein